MNNAVINGIQPPARGIPPSKWGSCAWAFIHYIALGYPENPTARDVDDYMAFFSSLAGVLPCKACREHLFDHMIDMPPDQALRSGRGELFQWTVDLHNAVNISLNKPIRSASDMQVYYTTQIIAAKAGHAMDMWWYQAAGVLLVGVFLTIALVASLRHRNLR